MRCKICGQSIHSPSGSRVADSDLLWKHITSIHDIPDRDSFTLLPAVKQEEGESKQDVIMKMLQQGVEDILDSSHFRQFLQTMSKFHEYSMHNQILIWMQRPDATRVAGFVTWKNLGRWVKKGEKGIAIFAPAYGSKTKCDVCGAKLSKDDDYCTECGAAVDRQIVTRFRVVYVYDLKQTEGEPIPEIEVPQLTGEANPELEKLVLSLVVRKNVIVDYSPRPDMDPDTKGYYRPPNFIWIRPEETKAQQLKTLLHEFSHYYTENVMRIDRKDAETIAESAAYVIGAHYGFDTGVRSFPYVAIWAQDKKVLQANLQSIHKVSNAILDDFVTADSKLMPQTQKIYTTWNLPVQEMERKYSINELKDIARSKGMSPTGTKLEIIKRILRGG